jgi:glycosyltransferase involved in cell wall biosynthesis
MNIVQAVGWYYPDSLGGTEVYVAALARAFRARGHHVSIAAPEPGARTPRTYVHEGCEVFRYPTPLAPTRDEAQGRVTVRGADEFHRWLSERRPDVVHSHTFVTGLGLHELAAARRAAGRVIVTTHASSLGFLCQRGTLMWRGRTLCDGLVDRQRCAACELEHRGAGAWAAAALARLPRALTAAARGIPGRFGTALTIGDLIEHNLARQFEMFRVIDRFVVLSQVAADIVLANGAPREQVVVNRLGVSQDTRIPVDRLRARDGVVRMGYVGRFDPVKGVDDLAQALCRLPADVSIRCEFRGPTGTVADRATRAALGHALGRDPRVSFGDGVPTADMPALVASYDVLCCPSRCLEGGPTVGLEALAVGTPVIAADAGGLAEVIQDGVSGRLVPPGDVDALAAALEEIARNPAGTIDQWRAHLPSPRTMRDVADDYLTLYAGCN